MDKHLLIGHLAHNEDWSVEEIALHTQLAEATVHKILDTLTLARVLPREPEVSLEEIMPSIFHDADA